MVYALQKYHHYLLGAPFKNFTDHSALKYLINKIALGGRIFIWLLLFQEFYFEIVVKPSKHNVGPDNLSMIELGEVDGNVGDELPDSYLFRVEMIPYQFTKITTFLTTRQGLVNFTYAY